MSPLVSRFGAKSSKGFGQFVAAASVPDAPIIGTVSRVDDDTVDVAFTSPSDNGSTITGYTVEGRRVSNAAALTITAVNSADVTSPVRYDATGVVEGVDYEFRIAAINSEGTGAYSDWSNDVAINPYDVPGTPTGVTASVTNTTTVSLSWTAPASDLTITSYTVAISPSLSGFPQTITDTTSPATVTGTFASGQAYTFQMRAVSSAGNGSYSTSSNSVTPNPAALRLCTALQEVTGCCIYTGTPDCGSLGAGSTCTVPRGTFDPGAC